MKYATNVWRARLQETSRSKLTSIDATIQGHQNCAFRIKAISDRGVEKELFNAAHQYANNCLIFADELSRWERTPGADFAFVEGVLGLTLGGNPFSVSERAKSRVDFKNQSLAEVERAAVRLESSGADVWRESWSNLTSKESTILEARVKTMLSDQAGNKTVAVATAPQSGTGSANSEIESPKSSTNFWRRYGPFLAFMALMGLGRWISSLRSNANTQAKKSHNES